MQIVIIIYYYIVLVIIANVSWLFADSYETYLP